MRVPSWVFYDKGILRFGGLLQGSLVFPCFRKPPHATGRRSERLTLVRGLRRLV